jgi:RNA polymerase sigma factor (sigma-70 family)
VDPDSTKAAEEAEGGSAIDLARRTQILRGAMTRYFARHVSDAAEIDDLIQDVFLRIVKRGGLSGVENFDGYVFETAASVLTDRFRRRKARRADQHLSFDPELHGGMELGPDSVHAGRQALRRTTVVLMELPERTRDVFILRRLEGLPYREIAVRLGLSVSAVEKHMVRAVRYLLANAGDSR